MFEIERERERESVKGPKNKQDFKRERK